MAVNKGEGRGPYVIEIVRVFDAPRELVFRNWVEAENVRTWFVPDGFSVTLSEIDARPGGRWRVKYQSDAGELYEEHGEFREVVKPEKLVFTLTQQDGRGNTGPETVVTVVFIEKGSQTEMIFNQTGFDSVARRDGNAEGWQECFGKLERHVTRLRK
jgi:uncharacterized protein YndB with AHSA1/START domain